MGFFFFCHCTYDTDTYENLCLCEAVFVFSVWKEFQMAQQSEMAQENINLGYVLTTGECGPDLIFQVRCRKFFGQAVEVTFKCGPYQMVK